MASAGTFNNGIMHYSCVSRDSLNQPTNPCTNTPRYQAHNIFKAHVSFLARGILYLAHEQKVLVQSAQCSCVRTRASKTQGVVDACLEDKPELQLPHSSVMTEWRFLILSCHTRQSWPSDASWFSATTLVSHDRVTFPDSQLPHSSVMTEWRFLILSYHTRQSWPSDTSWFSAANENLSFLRCW